MINGDKVKLRRIEKADLWHLWEWHEQEELYLFKSIKSFISWDDLYDNFQKYFFWKRDFIIENDADNIVGTCSYHDINWKNRSCSISFAVKEGQDKLSYLGDALQTIVSFIFNELNLIKIDSYALENSIIDIQAIEKIGFVKEGLLREHIFKNNQYVDVFIFALFNEV